MLFPAGSASWSTNLGSGDMGGVLDCPSCPGKGTQGNPEYGFNSNLCNVSIGDIANPAATVLTADRNVSNTNSTGMIYSFDSDLGIWHSGKSILSFLDGHATIVSITTEFPSNDLLKAGYILLPLCSSYIAKAYPDVLTVTNPSTGINFYMSSAALTLPVGCYRVNANDAMPSMLIAYDFSFGQPTNPGDRNSMALGMFISDPAELGLGSTSTTSDVSSGYYAGIWRCRGAPGESYGDASGHRFCMGSSTTCLTDTLPPNFSNVYAMYYGDQWYHMEVCFQNYMATLTVMRNSKILGSFSMPVNLPVDMAPGANKIALYSKWMGANKVITIKNINVYKLPEQNL